MAPLLGYLRQLQRELHVAVLLVHHARKGSGAKRPGQALRGSSDLHGWGDSNLYLRRNSTDLLLSVEHRAAPCQDNIPIELCANASALALAVKTGESELSTESGPRAAPRQDPRQRVIQAMKKLDGPVSIKRLRKICRIRTATLCQTLSILKDQGRVIHGPDGLSLTSAQANTAVSFPHTPIESSGNGNGKRLTDP
jgi:hypothetical protein